MNIPIKKSDNIKRQRDMYDLIILLFVCFATDRYFLRGSVLGVLFQHPLKV